MNPKPIPIFRLRYNSATGQWEQTPLDGFYSLTPQMMAELYQKSRDNMEQLRETFIERALEQSDMSAAKDIINRIRQL
jgi:hypothetical protein